MVSEGHRRAVQACGVVLPHRRRETGPMSSMNDSALPNFLRPGLGPTTPLTRLRPHYRSTIQCTMVFFIPYRRYSSEGRRSATTRQTFIFLDFAPFVVVGASGLPQGRAGDDEGRFALSGILGPLVPKHPRPWSPTATCQMRARAVGGGAPTSARRAPPPLYARLAIIMSRRAFQSLPLLFLLLAAGRPVALRALEAQLLCQPRFSPPASLHVSGMSSQ